MMAPYLALVIAVLFLIRCDSPGRNPGTAPTSPREAGSRDTAGAPRGCWWEATGILFCPDPMPQKPVSP